MIEQSEFEKKKEGLEQKVELLRLEKRKLILEKQIDYLESEGLMIVPQASYQQSDKTPPR